MRARRLCKIYPSTGEFFFSFYVYWTNFLNSSADRQLQSFELDSTGEESVHSVDLFLSRDKRAKCFFTNRFFMSMKIAIPSCPCPAAEYDRAVNSDCNFKPQWYSKKWVDITYQIASLISAEFSVNVDCVIAFYQGTSKRFFVYGNFCHVISFR